MITYDHFFYKKHFISNLYHSRKKIPKKEIIMLSMFCLSEEILPSNFSFPLKIRFTTLFPSIFVCLEFPIPLALFIFAPIDQRSYISPTFDFRPLSNRQTLKYKIPKFHSFLFRPPSILRGLNSLPPIFAPFEVKIKGDEL